MNPRSRRHPSERGSTVADFLGDPTGSHIDWRHGPVSPIEDTTMTQDQLDKLTADIKSFLAPVVAVSELLIAQHAEIEQLKAAAAAPAPVQPAAPVVVDPVQAAAAQSIADPAPAVPALAPNVVVTPDA